MEITALIPKFYENWEIKYSTKGPPISQLVC